MVDDAQTHLLPADAGGARQCRRGCTALGRRRRAARPAAPARRARSARCSTALAPSDSERLSNDPDILRERAGRRSALPIRRRPRAADRRLALGQGALAALAGGAGGVRGDAAGAARARSPPGPTRAARSTASSDIVERLSSGVNLLPPARGAAAAGRAPRADPHPRAGARRAAGAAAGAARRADRRIALRRAARRRRHSPSGCAEAMRGEPITTLALDRVRRLVNERRFALGVQLIAGARDPLDVADGLLPSRRRRDPGARRRRRRASSSARTGASPGGELVDPRARPARRRALTHASDLDLIYLFDAPDGRDVGRRQAARRDRLFQPPGAAGSPPRSACRPRPGRSTTSTRGCGPQGAQGHARGLARRLRATISASEAWTWEHMALCRARPVFGSARRREPRLAALIGVDPRGAARSGARCAPTRPRCAPRWRATSRRPGRSTSSSARAGWSISNSRSTRSS